MSVLRSRIRIVASKWRTFEIRFFKLGKETAFS